MAEQNKGGRPRVPPAPRDASDCRNLIAIESVKTKPRELTLRCLYRLLAAFERSEELIRSDAKNKAVEDANALKREEIELKKADYRLRFAKSSLGVRNLLLEAERLRKRIAELERREVA